MQALAYYIALPFIYLLSLAPFSVLYAVSSGVYFLLYRVLGYRKEVVFTNLRNSFPERSEEEIRKIADGFYRYLCDIFLETFKTLTISREEMLRRCRFEPASKKLIDDLAAANRNVVLVMGHFGNWEWGGNTFSMESKQQLYVIYHPLSNKYFDGLMYRMRTRFGSKLIAMKDTFRVMAAQRKELNATAFIADQAPRPETAYWTTFLHQDTPVFWGTEKISKKLGYPVVYIKISRLRRGYYEMTAEMLVPEPSAMAEGEILERFTRKLEADIREQPEIWLWSHRRWKHKRPR